MSGVTPSSTVGSAYSAVGKPAARLPPLHTRAPWATASAMCASNLAAVGSLFSGPMVVAGSNGSPSLTWSLVSATTRATNSARTAAWTRNRSPAVQLWPAHRYAASRAASAARSRSASSRITIGPLPPSSRSWVLPAARAATLAPVATDPMKPTPCTPGCPATASPTTGPGPGRKLNTPAGRPAAVMVSASSAQQAEVVGAGTQITTLPPASAGANSSAPIVYGQFHGLITPTTPSGTRRFSTRRAASVEGGAAPARRLASSAAIVKYSASSVTSSRASASSGFPWSSARARARSSARWRIAAATVSQTAARSNADSAAQAGAAALAAATASSTSARSATATEANVCPEDGLMAGALPARPARQVPPTHNRYSRTFFSVQAFLCSGAGAQPPEAGQGLWEHPELGAGDGQCRDAGPGRVEHRRGDGDEPLLEFRDGRGVAVAADPVQFPGEPVEGRDRLRRVALQRPGLRQGQGAIGEQHLAVGHRVRPGAPPDPAAGAAQNVGAGDLGDVEHVRAVRYGEVDGLPGLLGDLFHPRLHRGDQVEAAQRDRAQPDDLHAQPVALAGPGEKAGSLQRRGQP